MDFLLDHRGYIKNRESYNLEFKQNFQSGDNLIKIIKTMIGMANNKGGEIVFGIKDRPHLPIGMTNSRFHEVDPAEIDSKIREYFSSEIKWNSSTVTNNNKEFGILSISENDNKPIICKKNKDNVLREGAIYYRYRGQTKEIEYAELREILDKEKEKEKILWIKHIQKISIIGPRHVHLLDSFKGEITIGEGKILIDKNVIDKLHFIKEGHFSETNGEPTLKLIGDITGIADPELSVPADILYPLFSCDLQERLNLNSFAIQSIIWKLKIKGNPKYHTENKTGKRSSTVQKYSECLIPLLNRMLQRPDFLNTCRTDYSAFLSSKRVKKRRNE
jgi:hypothetical protein